MTSNHWLSISLMHSWVDSCMWGMNVLQVIFLQFKSLSNILPVLVNSPSVHVRVSWDLNSSMCQKQSVKDIEYQYQVDVDVNTVIVT